MLLEAKIFDRESHSFIHKPRLRRELNAERAVGSGRTEKDVQLCFSAINLKKWKDRWQWTWLSLDLCQGFRKKVTAPHIGVQEGKEPPGC